MENQEETTIAKNGEQMNKSMAAIVTPGEADESSEEEDNQNSDDYNDNPQRNHFNSLTTSNDHTNSISESRICEDNHSVGDSVKYNTLLHQKLREKSEQLKRELAELACGPYNSAVKEVTNISKQLIQSQKVVQNVSSTLRKVSKELFLLEESIDSIHKNKNISLINIRKHTPIDSSQSASSTITNNS